MSGKIYEIHDPDIQAQVDELMEIDHHVKRVELSKYDWSFYKVKDIEKVRNYSCDEKVSNVTKIFVLSLPVQVY
jgi:hypothetical protein